MLSSFKSLLISAIILCVNFSVVIQLLVIIIFFTKGTDFFGKNECLIRDEFKDTMGLYKYKIH